MLRRALPVLATLFLSHAALAKQTMRVLHLGSDGARLGVQLTELTPELRQYLGAPSDQGVIVGKVTADSAAAKAGLKVGDIITKIDGQAVDDAEDLQDAVLAAPDDATVKLDAIRDKKPVALSAKLGKRPEGMHAMQGMHAFEFPGGQAMSFGFDDEKLQKLEKKLEALEKRLDRLEKK